MKKTLALMGLFLSSLLITNQASAASVAEIKKQLSKVSPYLANVQVEETSIDNVFRFWSGGELNHIYYADGHVIIGDAWDVNRKFGNGKEAVSLGEEAKGARALSLIDASAGKSIDYGPANAERVINIFTDIDCGYCRKLHNEIGQLTAAGIKVRYFAFPRAGVNSASFNKYVSVWCADNQQAALDAAKAGANPASKSCANPIADTHKLGRDLGLRGTPMLVYDDGRIVGGYKPASTLIQEMGL